MQKGISTDPYKGVRDFYPEDMATQNYLFGVMRQVAERFGYAEYNASVLEPAELYRAKSGEEIVNEQTYTFVDRGEREVTLRPEMTPTVARLVAARKRELPFPLRWYSIPNLFRYERPQHGRLREHWQLNVDIFGVEGIDADVEIISIAYHIMKAFGMRDEDFEIRINNRRLFGKILTVGCNLTEEESKRVIKVLDRRHKISTEEFEEQIDAIIGTERKDQFIESISENNIGKLLEGLGITEEISAFSKKVRDAGIKNSRYDKDLVRGFDYYTGMIFEVFDKNPENRRSIFGGGRYDELLDIFDMERVPAVGFGMGDVMIREVLKTYNLLPEYKAKTDIYLCPLNLDFVKSVNMLASELREQRLNVSVDYTGKKVSDQIKTADKQKIPFIIVIGEDEISNKQYTIKELSTGTETKLSAEDIPAFIASASKSVTK